MTRKERREAYVSAIDSLLFNSAKILSGRELNDKSFIDFANLLEKNTEKFNKGAKFDGYAWRSFITIDNRKIDLGRYNTEQEAQESYERAVLSI